MGAKLDVVLSVDWEGLSLYPVNLSILQKFKEKYQLPLVHYFNPAYFTSPNIQFSGDILSHVFDANDEIALHLHGPKHFIEASGVTFKSGPSFANKGDPYTGLFHGQEVMLHSYSQQEFSQIVAYSIKLFEEYGFERPKSFRAGGWMLSPKQMTVLSDVGIIYDSSSVPGDYFNDRGWQGENLHRYISLLWSHISMDTQPYYYSSHLLEIPNNLGAIDYWRENEVELFVDKILSVSKTNGYHCAVITAHQESAAEHFWKIEKFVDALMSSSMGFDIQFVTNRNIRKDDLFGKEIVIFEENKADVIFL